MLFLQVLLRPPEVPHFPPALAVTCTQPHLPRTTRVVHLFRPAAPGVGIQELSPNLLPPGWLRAGASFGSQREGEGPTETPGLSI